MKIVNISKAKTNLSKLVALVYRGEKVVIVLFLNALIHLSDKILRSNDYRFYESRSMRWIDAKD
jgi:hypothetical protein